MNSPDCVMFSFVLKIIAFEKLSYSGTIPSGFTVTVYDQFRTVLVSCGAHTYTPEYIYYCYKLGPPKNTKMFNQMSRSKAKTTTNVGLPATVQAPRSEPCSYRLSEHFHHFKVYDGTKYGLLAVNFQTCWYKSSIMLHVRPIHVRLFPRSLWVLLTPRRER